jgi:hypothetical protein
VPEAVQKKRGQNRQWMCTFNYHPVTLKITSMKKTLLCLLVCKGILYTANAQAPRVYDTTTSTVINYPSPKERPLAIAQPETAELHQLSVTLTLQPLARKIKASERRAKKKAGTALTDTKVQAGNAVIQADAAKKDIPVYAATKGTH